MTSDDNQWSFWKPGDRVVFESMVLGRTLSALATIVVEDSDSLTVLYLAIGAEALRLLQTNGESVPRVVPPEQFASMELTTIRAVWTGHHMLMLARPDEAHAIFLRWTGPDWSFLGWYVNLQEPLERTTWGFAMRDLFLDIVVDPSLAWNWKDEDELAQAVERGRLVVAEADAIRAEGERVIARIEAQTWPFDAGYEFWRPDPAWPIPEVPANWSEA